jgi:phospholipase/carboxylesterase
MPESLPCVEITPRGPVRASIIWLHGLGADGNDFVPVVPELGLPDVAGIHFVFPHAPHRPVTINGGYVMRAWYDIVAVNTVAREDENGIRDSAGAVRNLIEREIGSGVAPENIVLAGFSQGGAIALHTALRYAAPLAGVLALSTYLPLANRLPDEANAANAGVPIWMGHGTADTVVPIGLAERSRDLLRQAGYDVAWHAYAMGHSVVPEEIRAIGTWLARLLSRPA